MKEKMKNDIKIVWRLNIETSGGIVTDWSALMIRDDGQALKRQMKANEFLSVVYIKFK